MAWSDFTKGFHAFALYMIFKYANLSFSKPTFDRQFALIAEEESVNLTEKPGQVKDLYFQLRKNGTITREIPCDTT